MPVLVAPAVFGPALRAPVVAAALGRGLERAGLEPPDLCPVAGGGGGTLEVLLPVLGGESANGFGLVEGGATAIVEAASDPARTGERMLAAADAGPATIVLAAAETGEAHLGDAAAAVEAGGGLGGARLLVLRERATASAAHAGAPPLGARQLPGAAFVLDALGFDARMRAARAVIAGEARLDAGTLRGRVVGEIATRARQAGVPCHAVVGVNAIDRFDARILDLQQIVEASSLELLEAAAERLAQIF